MLVYYRQKRLHVVWLSWQYANAFKRTMKKMCNTSIFILPIPSFLSKYVTQYVYPCKPLVVLPYSKNVCAHVIRYKRWDGTYALTTMDNDELQILCQFPFHFANVLITDVLSFPRAISPFMLDFFNKACLSDHNYFLYKSYMLRKYVMHATTPCRQNVLKYILTFLYNTYEYSPFESVAFFDVFSACSLHVTEQELCNVLKYLCIEINDGMVLRMRKRSIPCNASI